MCCECVCKCVLYCCHLVATQLQLTNTSYHVISYANRLVYGWSALLLFSPFPLLIRHGHYLTCYPLNFPLTFILIYTLTAPSTHRNPQHFTTQTPGYLFQSHNFWFYDALNCSDTLLSGQGPLFTTRGAAASPKRLVNVAYFQFATEPIWAQNPDSQPTKVYPSHT